MRIAYRLSHSVPRHAELSYAFSRLEAPDKSCNDCILWKVELQRGCARVDLRIYTVVYHADLFVLEPGRRIEERSLSCLGVGDVKRRNSAIQCLPEEIVTQWLLIGVTDNDRHSKHRCRQGAQSHILLRQCDDDFGVVPLELSRSSRNRKGVEIGTAKHREKLRYSSHSLLEHRALHPQYPDIVTSLLETAGKYLGDFVNSSPP